MGILAGAGSFIGKMFGTDKAIETTINHVGSALDKLHYSAEEKAEDAAKDRSEFRQMLVNWLANTQGQNLSRRVIALTVTAIWAIQHLTMLSLSVTSVWVEDAEKIINTVEIMAKYEDNIKGAMILVLGFYFAAPHLGTIVNGALDRFGKPVQKLN